MTNVKLLPALLAVACSSLIPPKTDPHIYVVPFRGLCVRGRCVFGGSLIPLVEKDPVAVAEARTAQRLVIDGYVVEIATAATLGTGYALERVEAASSHPDQVMPISLMLVGLGLAMASFIIVKKAIDHSTRAVDVYNWDLDHQPPSSAP
jgi:hypothetical protein